MFNELASIYVTLLKQWLFVPLMLVTWNMGTFLVQVLSESVLKAISIKKHLENTIFLEFTEVHLIYKLPQAFNLSISMEYSL
jgi:hypothetical protein